jgi:hypothetical protein
MAEEIYDDWADSLEEDRQSGRGSGGKKWGLLWRPTEAPTKIHLSRPAKPYVHPTSGKEFPFRASKRHFLPGLGRAKKGAFVECGVDRGDQCVVDAYINPAAYGLVNVAPSANLAQYPAKVYYAIGGWIEEDFHLVDVENQGGEGTHKERWRCLGRGCTYCKDGWPMVFGKKFYTEISPGQWQHSFHDLHKRIENSTCKCGGTIYVTSFVCSKCEKIRLDVSTVCDCGSGDVGLNTETGQASCGKCGKSWSGFYTEHQKLYEESNEPYKCKCGHKGFLRPVRLCSTEGCVVEPYGVFDCQLTIRVTGNKKEKRLLIDEYLIQEPDPRLFDPKFQGDDEFAAQIAEAHAKPMDLDWLLKTPSADEQCKILGKPNPFNAVARGAHFAKYDKGEVEGEPATEELGEEGSEDPGGTDDIPQ